MHEVNLIYGKYRTHDFNTKTRFPVFINVNDTNIFCKGTINVIILMSNIWENVAKKSKRKF